ncbi:hypothetical protein CANCADRAFT_1566 [Tortispora caseinolytica NRRL Y-17796]|uniref:Armadillo-like helical domain-containing protein n=1 Tax=Tortispora caseinolytica NRRL Y-17796 TaxID=767744 RepID=A0A1E4TML0_9ASCO|nr:hypothetical protein CANCADRAFT_1566 [Tortispora caseinolytica NRRL Y-17796]
MDSPLSRVDRGNLEPKVLSLYRELFVEGQDASKPEGFWYELFLLKPSKIDLFKTIDALTALKLLEMSHITRDFFSRSVYLVADDRIAPQTRLNALSSLQVFLKAVFAKKYPNSTSDFISILAGPNKIDELMYDFVSVLDSAIDSSGPESLRITALHTALIAVQGSYRSSLIYCFLSKDLFYSAVSLVRDYPFEAYSAFLLLSLLADVDSSDGINLYKQHISTLSNDSFISSGIIDLIEHIKSCVNDFTTLINPANSALFSFQKLRELSFFAFASKPPRADLLRKLPRASATALMPLYEFSLSCPRFSALFVSHKSSNAYTVSDFISLTSFLAAYQSTSLRSSTYARLAFLIINLWLTNPDIMTSAANSIIINTEFPTSENYTAPYLAKPQPLVAWLIYTSILALNSNRIKPPHTNLYILVLANLELILNFLRSNSYRLDIAWSDLWTSLVDTLTYALHLESKEDMTALTLSVTHVLNIAIIHGDSFLLSKKSYDDLLYKLIASGSVIKDASLKSSTLKNNIGVKSLCDIVNHYQQIMRNQTGASLLSDNIVRAINSAATPPALPSPDLFKLSTFDAHADKNFHKRMLNLVLSDIYEVSEFSI